MIKMKTPDMSTKNQILQWINSTLNVFFCIIRLDQLNKNIIIRKWDCLLSFNE